MEGWRREDLLGWCLQFPAFITSCRISSAYGIIVSHTSGQLNLFGDLAHGYFAYVVCHQWLLLACVVMFMGPGVQSGRRLQHHGVSQLPSRFDLCVCCFFGVLGPCLWNLSSVPTKLLAVLLALHHLFNALPLKLYNIVIFRLWQSLELESRARSCPVWPEALM